MPRGRQFMPFIDHLRSKIERQQTQRQKSVARREDLSPEISEALLSRLVEIVIEKNKRKDTRNAIP